MLLAKLEIAKIYQDKGSALNIFKPHAQKASFLTENTLYFSKHHCLNIKYQSTIALQNKASITNKNREANIKFHYMNEVKTL